MAGSFATHETVDGERESARPDPPAPVRRTAAPLVVGAADDRAEVEADRVADEVIKRLQAGESSEVGGQAGQTRQTEGGQSHVHDGCHGIARQAAPSTGAPEVGHEGGAISDDLTTRIESKRGGGSALPGDVRRRMEAGFGASLADVRVHTDGESADLNRSISARAFTTGSDIFFGSGEFSPGTAAGERVLAHEIAHTRQQGGGARRIHRLTVQNTQISKVSKIEVMQYGASGLVASFSDGKTPVVVKAGQSSASEIAVGASLQGEAGAKDGRQGAKKGAKGYDVSAPESRIVSEEEKADLLDRFDALQKKGKVKSGPKHDGVAFRAGLASALPTMVTTEVSGVNMREAFAESKVTGEGDSMMPHKDSAIFKICNDPNMLRTLAHSIPTDVIMGMDDRLVGNGNPENFMFDKKTGKFSYTDNTKKGMGGFLTQTAEGTGRASFDTWAGGVLLQDFQMSRAAYADKVWANLFDGQYGVFAFFMQRGDASAKEKKIWPAMVNMATQMQQPMTASIQAGIEAGWSDLKSTLANPLKHVAGIPDAVKRREALTNLIARSLMMQGEASADKAWQQAELAAAALLGVSTKELKPAQFRKKRNFGKPSDWAQQPAQGGVGGVG